MLENIETFKKQGYCIIKNVLSEDIINLYSQYALFDELQDFAPDQTQVYGAHAKYADPAMESMLLYLHKTVEQNTGLNLFPTYSFYRVYRSGDELVEHKDRPSCEISTTVCFNYDYKNHNYSWPIYMNENPVHLTPGDMVIYRGCDLNHYRKKLNIQDNVWHVQGFFHYVNANGPYRDFKYDQRDNVGMLKGVPQAKPYIEFT